MQITDFEVKQADGSALDLSAHKGKVLLIVNTASKCGFTPQYEGLENLYQEYADQGLEILAFPCNQFMGQEPGTNEEIKEFVTSHYGVNFQLFSKVDVNGPHTHEVYRFLRRNSPLYDKKKDQVQNIPWNFTKFLVDSEG